MNERSNLSLRIYLAGKVPKGAAEEAAARDWRALYVNVLGSSGDFEFSSPEDSSLDENFPEEIFGHDCYLVQQCDIVVVNASEKLGVGTAQEMLIAKYFHKYVFTVLPPGSHHRRSELVMSGVHVSEWIHPFIACTSDAIYETLEELQAALADDDGPLQSHAKGLDVIDDAIHTYKTRRLHRTSE